MKLLPKAAFFVEALKMFHIIFGPAMAIMSRLRFALKLGVMGVLFIAPLSGLVYYLYGKLHTDIQFAETERVGLRQFVPGRDLAKAVQAHRGASQIALGGDAAAKERLAGITNAVDAKLGALETTADGSLLGTSGAVSEIKKQWLDLKEKNLRLSPEESLEQHSELVRNVLKYMELTSDRSGLTLDPGMDSYYLMDAAVFRLPRVIDYAGRLRARGSGILQRRVKTPAEDTRLSVLREMYKVDFESLQVDLEKAFGANSALAAALDARSKEGRAAGNEFLKNEVGALMSGDLTQEPQVYFEKATKAIDNLYGLFDVVVEQLDGVLAARSHRLQGDLNLVLYGTGAVLLAVLYLFAGMLLSVLRSLRSIEAGAERLAQGDVSQFVDSHSTDELRRVGGAVNSVAQTLQKFTQAELDMARAHNEHGRISETMRASEFPGAYGDMARTLNAMVKGHIDVQTRFTELMGEYAGGKFDNRMPPLPGERKAISDAAEKVCAGLESSAKAAQFNARVKVALDHVSIPVRIADNEGQILYINNALKEMLRTYGSGFRQQIPGFDPAKVVGGSIGMFYADPASALARLRGLTGPTTSRIVLGGRDCDLVTTPVFNENGERIGTAGQWADLTAQLAAEKEIAAIVEAAAAGDFKMRVAETDKTGFLLQIAQGLNAVLGTSEQALGEIGRILKALAQGDLSQNIRADFKGVFAELKDNSNETIVKLRDIITQIREASESINTAAREIATGNNDLSRRTEDQASSLEETASSMEEFAATVRQNAENAQEANRLAAEASESAQQGGTVVARVVTTMASITESNREIADITTLIDGIAFQTNLLALNAAVEAARAGEQGRGFAVVASEVRNLAQRAAEAAKNIKAVIANSIGKVEDGARLVGSAGQAMEEIVAQVKRVGAIIGEIAAASKEQSGGIEQVNQAITQIDQNTQQNAALVEEATAAAKSLEGQSDALVQAVAIFKLAHGHGAAQKREPVAHLAALADGNSVLH